MTTYKNTTICPNVIFADFIQRRASLRNSPVVKLPKPVPVIPTGLILLKDVITISGYSESTIYAFIHNDTFPKPVQRLSRHALWSEQEIRDWAKDNKLTPETLRQRRIDNLQQHRATLLHHKHVIPDGLLCFKDVMTITRLSYKQIYKKIKRGLFPHSIGFRCHLAVWSRDDIMDWELRKLTGVTRSFL